MKSRCIKLIILLSLFIIIGFIYFYKSKKVILLNQLTPYSYQENYQYYFQKLNHQEQTIYLDLYKCFQNFEEKIAIRDLTLAQIQKIYQYILMDNPSLFYVKNSFRYIQKTNEIEFQPLYQYHKEEVQKYNQQIEKQTYSIIHEANQQSNDLDKMKIIYNYIIETVRYQKNKNDQNIISVFINKESVCAGYAKAYQYLLVKVGIKATYISGISKNNISKENFHAWIMILLDNDYYYSDPTWGDVEEKEITHCCYSYFLMNSDEMLRCYQPDSYYEKTIHFQKEYYKDMGCYMERYDRSVLSYAIQRASKQRIRVAEIKCQDEQLYQQIKNEIQNSQLGYLLLEENHCYNDKILFSWNDYLRTIEIIF